MIQPIDFHRSEARIEGRSIIVERVIHATRERVFAAFSSPDIGTWWGPEGFTTTTHSMAFEVDGVWRYTMHGPDGRDYENRIVYQVIDPPRQLAWVHDEGEEAQSNQGLCFETSMTLHELPDQPGHTRVCLVSKFPDDEQLRLVVEQFGAVEGGQQHLARLEAFVLQAMSPTG